VKTKILKDSYLLVNLAFIGIILSIFTYSVIFTDNGRKYPVPSGAAILTGKISASSGLSRSFSEIVRFNFRESKLYNPYGIRIFSFFAIQLLMRIAAIIFALHSDIRQRRMLITTDAVLSSLLLTICFWPFIKLTVELINGS
jgi:hypothetical protein